LKHTGAEDKENALGDGRAGKSLAYFCPPAFCELKLLGRILRPFSASNRGAHMQFVTDHLYFYKSYLLEAWHNMSPMQYGYLLVTIAVVGWLLMKSSPR